MVQTAFFVHMVKR